MLEGKQVCGAGTGAAREEDAFQKLDQFRNGLLGRTRECAARAEKEQERRGAFPNSAGVII
jgi:hypothetical protein